MNYLIALDLEGVGGVVGVPYEGLGKNSDEWRKARAQAILEVNAVARALFETDADRVVLWDNHGGGGNLEYEKLDGRIEVVDRVAAGIRQAFAKDYGFDAMYFLGYHAMEGTVGAVLAHTWSSKDIQFIKVNLKPVCEAELDGYYAAEQGYSPVFFAGDDKANQQAKECFPEIITVETKKALTRNSAIFRDNDELLSEIYERAKAAASLRPEPKKLEFPSVVEVRYTRMERAAERLEFLQKNGVKSFYSTDAHTVFSIVRNIEEFSLAAR